MDSIELLGEYLDKTPMDRMQKISALSIHAPCRNCGTDLMELNNFKYADKTITAPLFFEELCTCLGCGAFFLIHYELFDADGHINIRTFAGDVNDPKYNWQDNLTDEQKAGIAKHLQSCQTCVDRLLEEQLNDAWFADLLHNQNRNSAGTVL